MKSILNNSNGSSPLHAVLIAAVTGVVGFTGWFVYSSQKSTDKLYDASKSASDTTPTKVNRENTSIEQAKVAAVSTEGWKTLSVEVASIKYPTSLEPQGTCDDGQGLLGIIYNSPSTNYSCSGPRQALGYAAIVFGAGSKSVIGDLNGNASNASTVKMANGLSAQKYVYTDNERGNDYRYVVYENVQGDKHSYAVYKTGVGFSDEDKFLKDFTLVVENGWTIK